MWMWRMCSMIVIGDWCFTLFFIVIVMVSGTAGIRLTDKAVPDHAVFWTWMWELNSTLRPTGSQCISLRTGVMCSRRPVRIISLHAWVLHSLLTVVVGTGCRWCRTASSCNSPGDWTGTFWKWRAYSRLHIDSLYTVELFAVRPSAVVSPQTLRAYQGDMAEFNCDVTGSPHLRIQWTKDGGHLPERHIIQDGVLR